jgi:hypothetical protein
MNKIWDSRCGYSVANSSCRAAARILGGWATVPRCTAALSIQWCPAPLHTLRILHIREAYLRCYVRRFFGFCVLLRCPSATCGGVNCFKVEGGRCDHWYMPYIFYTIFCTLDLTRYTVLYASFSIYGYTFVYIYVLYAYVSPKKYWREALFECRQY